MPFVWGLLFGGTFIGGAAYALMRAFYRRSLPQVAGTLRVEGLRAPVEVIRDEWGVPHIYAQNMHDLLFTQGYVHAQDRLWQMDRNRRIGQGRLAEIFGAVAFSTDQFLRTVGFARAAQAELRALDAESLHALDAYAHGVNAFIQQHQKRLPLEFVLLRYQPEPWTPLDTVLFSKVMAWSLSSNWDTEILHAALIGKLGAERAARLKGEYIADNPLVLPQQTFASIAESVLAQFRDAQDLMPLGAFGGMSNNWVVDGMKSVTGKPLLANDPHLALQMPSIWYENHLVAPDFEVTGVSFPGTPFVTIGHNREVAWGFTNAFPDVQDIYVERLNPADPTQYEYEGKWEQADVRREQIRVKGETAPRVVEVVTTRHGPIINPIVPSWVAPSPSLPRDEGRVAGEGDVFPSPVGYSTDGGGVRGGGFALALRWVAHEPGSILRAAMRINRASSWTEFCEAVRDWHVPSQNMVYADRAGNIGYVMPGRVPIRAKGIGAAPVPGWTRDYEWQGWIPHEELPQVINPAQHFIATANNQVVGQEYPHFLTSETMNGYRARRIVELLNAKEKLSADDFARMQVDLYCAPAKIFCELLTTLTPQSDEQRRALDLIRNWDYVLTKDSVAGAMFKVAQHFALKRVFAPWLGTLTDYFIGVGFHPLLAPTSAYMDRSLVTLNRVLTDNECDWFKDEQGNALTREQILSASLADALAYLRTALGSDMTRWAWGRIHRAGFNHTLGAQKPLDKIFSRGPYEYGGDTNTVWQAAYVPRLPLDTNGGSASWRQIIDLSDWDASRAVHTTGQSGQPASKHYDDMIPLWLNGEYHPMLWSRAQVEAHAVARLRLEP